jgi:hypothetical protein
MKKNKEIIIIVDLNNNLLDQNEDEIIYQIDYFNIYKKLSYLVILFFYSIKEVLIIDYK